MQFFKPFFFSLFTLSLFADYCYFIPPENWEFASFKKPSEHVKVGFLAPGGGDFRTSINLAIEEGVDTSLKEYVKAVKDLQKNDPMSTWRDLGNFQTKAGKARLIEQTHKLPWAEIKTLQLLFVKDEKAYILTGAILKEDFLKFQKPILKTFASLKFCKTLFEPIENLAEQKQIASFFETLGTKEDKEKEWQELQEEVLKHESLGSFWTFSILKEGHEKIFKANAESEAKEGALP